MRHVAIVTISNELLLNMLDFKGGIVHRVFMDDDFLEPTSFNVVIEHPDLPEVPINERLPHIKPIMQYHYGQDSTLLKVERIDPPKLPPKNKI